MKTHDKLLTTALPKWPQMLTMGKPVSTAQAKEIIRRTDTFFSYPDYAGNDVGFRKRVMREVGINFTEDRYWTKINYDELLKWQENWGYIHTEYVHNTWIASSYIYGPYGWCSPSGKIGYTDNIGKWPSVETVLEDWTILAKEFPFLDLVATLISGEQHDEESVPLVSIRVKDGLAVLADPSSPEITNLEFEPPENRTDDEMIRRIQGGNLAEQGIQWSWIQEWGKRSK